VTVIWVRQASGVGCFISGLQSSPGHPVSQTPEVKPTPRSCLTTTSNFFQAPSLQRIFFFKILLSINMFSGSRGRGRGGSRSNRTTTAIDPDRTVRETDIDASVARLSAISKNYIQELSPSTPSPFFSLFFALLI
jgi:hypothetical protein